MKGDEMKRWLVAMVCLLLVNACKPSVFPFMTLQGVDPMFEFSRWRMDPNLSQRQKIQLGGRILQAGTEGDTLTIVTAQLPIAQNPLDGPEETGQSGGEFVILYGAMVHPGFLQSGTRLLVVGETGAPTQVKVGEALQTLPTVTAQCLHFWNAGGKDIVVAGSSIEGRKTAREQTYCKTF
jgi:starvation-inducible outer membrane lipoprotein